MESHSTKLTIDEFKVKIQHNFDNGDELHRIEPLISGFIQGTVKITGADGSDIDGVDKLQLLMDDCTPFNLYLEDITLKNLFFSELAHIKDTWTCFKDRPHKQIYTKKEEGMGIMSVFYRFKLNSTMLAPFALLCEIDQMKTWIPSITQSDIIKDHSNFHKVLYVKREMPFPITDREMVLVQSQIIIPERKGAMIIIRSINETRQKTWQVENMPAENAKLIRAEMVKGFMYLEYIDEENIWFHGFFNVNPKLALIPDWFLNSIVKRVVDKVIIKMREKDVFENDTIKERVKANPEKFEKIKQALREAEIPMP